jgi:UPF0271 protein
MMKINCDMGESFGAWTKGADAEIMPLIDMANIACGFHASDPHTMYHTIALAMTHQVTIGAHPGYPDLLGFGRNDMDLSSQELINMLLYQVGALQALCHAQATRVAYIKPHGALYHRMMQDEKVFTSIVQSVAMLEGNLALMVMALPDNTMHQRIAKQYQVPLLLEAFCDRAYADDGSLQSRKKEGAVFTDMERIRSQAKQLIQQQSVISVSGKRLPIQANTLCIHGDSDLAVISAQAINALCD